MAFGESASERKPAVELAWAPQPGPQQSFVTCPIDDVVYGGARGGGKTDATLGDFAIHAQKYGGAAKGLFVRRTLVALSKTIERAKQIYRGIARWHAGEKYFIWPSGATLYMRYLDRDDDADAYQGHDYTRVYVEELTQFPDPKPVDKLVATLRSAAGVKTGFRASCNPGGAGHSWVKARYIDKGPWNVTHSTFACPFTGKDITRSRVFIPARLSDNPVLLRNDPGYVANLYSAGSEQLVKAWLNGDWDIIEGAFFDRWSVARNVCRHFEPPKHWLRFGSFDWGSARPFSYGLWAVASEDKPFISQTGEWRVLPRGGLYRFREWYGMQKDQPNVGMKLTAEQVATGIKERERGEQIAYRVADPAIFSENGGPSIAERMSGQGVSFRPGDNRRVGHAGAMGGWDQLRERIDGEDDERPMLVSSENCRDLNRTLPALQHDNNRMEDVDSDGEDHAPDDARYGCMSRPWVRPASAQPRARDPYRPQREDESWRTV